MKVQASQRRREGEGRRKKAKERGERDRGGGLGAVAPGRCIEGGISSTFLKKFGLSRRSGDK